MNPHLENILKIIEQAEDLTPEQKAAAIKSLTDADKEMEITAFKLDRTDKVKRTTAILLEETIEELEQKRKSVEAQNKELEIEAALERVRTVAMSMNKPTDMLSVCKAVYTELQSLGFKDLRNALIHTYHDEENEFDDYDYSDLVQGHISKIPYRGNPIIEKFIREIRSSKDAFAEVAILGTDLETWKTFRDANKEAKDDRLNTASALYYYHYSVGNAALGISTFAPITEEQLIILKRFRNVFDLAYQRYIDITNAAAQAREAQIEASLEKIRARTMAMQHSNELPETSYILFQQLKALGEPAEQLTIGVVDEENKVFEISATLHGNKLQKIFRHSIDEPYMMRKMYHAWKTEQSTLVVELRGDELNAYNRYRNALTNTDIFPTDLGNEDKRIVYASFFSKGLLALASNEPRPPQSLELLERFAAAFDLTYTRFLDLQKAEAQTRESQIEVALERVRTQAMAMQKSDDLSNAVAVVFEEMDKLNLGMLRCGIGILDREKRTADVFSTTISEGDKIVQVSGNESMDIHPLLKGAFDTWLTLDDHDYILEGDDLVEYYKAVSKTNFHLPESQLIADKNQRQYYFRATFTQGGLFAFSETPFTDEAKSVLKRFAAVFDLTYQRFLDLQKAESQAREAQIETALERVRSRTLAMQRSDELAETAAVLFRQLILLGIQPNRLYIAIIKDDTGKSEFWITDEDGSKVSSAFKSNLDENNSFKKMLKGWKEEKKSLIIDIQGQELKDYFQYLESIHVPFKGGLEQKRRVQSIAYFNNGFIGMASPEELPKDTIVLLERFAAVFNLTYTRFNDLKIAEAHAVQAEQDLVAIKEAKQKAETALIELQATQKQLIQSEKMASLGELTAGIAHEIQNPLNFVNNFSEVSKELLYEMKEAIEKGDTEDATDIMNDVIQNLEKINHHGKRADGIVKGMLQHSRSSSGQKELTDINALCDEYLRLAYHGLRAKDKSFNAKFETDFDESVGSISVMPQEMGRVILNLINNAFYAVTQRKKENEQGYDPTVIVSTKRTKDKIEISVHDNGIGIPAGIVEKIFQPFFTTKPTGQGTGLGLSLSYDIITQGHGGDLKLETKESQGTKFIIGIPFSRDPVLPN